MDNSQIVINGLKTGASKMVILTSLIRNDETLDLGAAGVLYKRVGTENHLLLNKEDKDNLVVEIAAQFNTDGRLDREAAVNALCERGAMTKNAANNRLKGYCIQHKIEFPISVRGGSSKDMVPIHEAYKSWMDQEASRESIQAGLVQHFGYTKKNVGQAFLKIGRELGFIEGGAAPGRNELAQWFATTENITGSKKEITERLVEDTGIAPATANSRYSNFLFAIEYHKILCSTEQAA